MRVLGGDALDPAEVAADLTPWWRTHLAELPSAEFARPGWLRAALLDSVIRRGWVERVGRHEAGQWLYRLTAFGRALVTAARAAEGAPA